MTLPPECGGSPAAEILRYLKTHPGADDTLEGIQAWWSTVAAVEQRAANVGTALEDLVRTGHLIRNTARDRRTHYRFRRRTREP